MGERGSVLLHRLVVWELGDNSQRTLRVVRSLVGRCLVDVWLLFGRFLVVVLLVIGHWLVMNWPT